MAQVTQSVYVSLPATPLRPYISHYWLSLDNRDPTYSILPDGTTDIVITASEARCHVDMFGTTTSRRELPLYFGNHYLGIRFKPGQSRHFLDVQATDLTNSVQPAEDSWHSELIEAVEIITTHRLFACLDVLLLRRLSRQPPRRLAIDDVILQIESQHGVVRIGQLADRYGKSRRQFERQFLNTVGISAKLFAEIIRFQRAASLLTHSILPLVQIAAAIGYTDQSHLNHEFTRFYGWPPSKMREDVAFLQDEGSSCPSQ